MKAFEKHLVQACPSCQRFMYTPEVGAPHLVWLCDECAARLEQPKTMKPKCTSPRGPFSNCENLCKNGCLYPSTGTLVWMDACMPSKAKQSISSEYYFSERVKPKGWVIVVDGQCLQTIYKTAEDARAAAEYSIQSKFSCGGNGIHSIAQIGAL